MLCYGSLLIYVGLCCGVPLRFYAVVLCYVMVLVTILCSTFWFCSSVLQFYIALWVYGVVLCCEVVLGSGASVLWFYVVVLCCGSIRWILQPPLVVVGRRR